MVKLIASFWLTSTLFVFIAFGGIAWLAGFNLVKFLLHIKEEILLVLAASSSETAIPTLMEKLESLGCSRSLGFLLLSLFGAGLLLLRLRTREWQAAPIIAAFSILLVCMASHINLGVRHILPIYPVLSIAAGYFVAVSLRPFRSVRSIFALSLLLWCSFDSLSAHPDNLAWFNPIASAHPEHFRLDLDLDWGQDFRRLSKRLQELHAASVEMPSFFGVEQPQRIGLPPVRDMSCDAPMTGYVAVSFNMLYLYGPSSECPARFLQLEKTKPMDRVGKSILLFHFP